MCSQFVTYVSTQRQLRSKIPLSFDSFSLFWAAMAASTHPRTLWFKYVTSQSLSRWQKLEQLKHCFNKTVKGVMACDVSLEAMFFPFLVALLYTPATKSLLVATLVFFCSFYSFFLLLSSQFALHHWRISAWAEIFLILQGVFNVPVLAQGCPLLQWWIGKKVGTLGLLLITARERESKWYSPKFLCQ